MPASETRPPLYPKGKKAWRCNRLPKIHSKGRSEKSTWRASTLCSGTPMKRFPFSNGWRTPPHPPRLSRHFCALTRSGTRSATIRAFRNWLRKRNRKSTIAESKPELHLGIAHVLFMDVLGYSKLLINDRARIRRRSPSLGSCGEQLRLGSRKLRGASLHSCRFDSTAQIDLLVKVNKPCHCFGVRRHRK